MTMREQVAVALATADGFGFSIEYLKLADAALAAIRLPTDSMIQAGYDDGCDGMPLASIYTAMIDAARTEAA